jgi:hypothetical protein
VRDPSLSERALVLAPQGRDARIAVAILQEAKIASEACSSRSALVHELDNGAGFVVVTEEALRSADLAPLDAWLRAQEDWSDLPFVLLTRGGGLERNPVARRYLDILGNVTFIERPFHPPPSSALPRPPSAAGAANTRPGPASRRCAKAKRASRRSPRM